MSLANNELVRPEIQRVNEADAQFIEMSIYNDAVYHYDGAPLTGFLVRDLHPNGLIWSEYEYVNGEQNGWEVSYHENGKVAYQVLMYGATSIVFYEYDENGDEINGGFVAPISLYNECARLTGMELLDEE